MADRVELSMHYRKGKPYAGYLYLRKKQGKYVRSRELDNGLVVDFDESGQPYGIEIVSPSLVNPDDSNAALRDLGLPPLPRQELAPLNNKVVAK
jgi:uncharacterized protein YuzE